MVHALIPQYSERKDLLLLTKLARKILHKEVQSSMGSSCLG